VLGTRGASAPRSPEPDKPEPDAAELNELLQAFSKPKRKL
jgi:hypothetical protein